MNTKTSDPQSAPECFDSALRILGIRAHSAKQLQSKLKRKGFDPEVVAATMQRLLADGLLDENSFAEQFVRSKLRRKNGSLKITRELEATGVSREVTRQALARVLEEESEEDHLRAACQKRLRPLVRRHGLEWLQSDAGRNKLISQLLQQGYETGAVLRTVSEQVKQAAADLSF
jgi:regulatory protein